MQYYYNCLQQKLTRLDDAAVMSRPQGTLPTSLQLDHHA